MRQWFPQMEVESVAHHAWTQDPHFRGTWAVPRPQQLESLLQTAGISGNVALAGADLSTGSYALIDGAIDTGIRAARKILTSLSASAGRDVPHLGNGHEEGQTRTAPPIPSGATVR